jgi:hypothetical protein
MKSSVFIHLMQLPSNPILFGFGWLALRCDFSKTKTQPLTEYKTWEGGLPFPSLCLERSHLRLVFFEDALCLRSPSSILMSSSSSLLSLLKNSLYPLDMSHLAFDGKTDGFVIEGPGGFNVEGPGDLRVLSPSSISTCGSGPLLRMAGYLSLLLRTDELYILWWYFYP